MSKIETGTISHGTLRTEDLLSAFLPYLDESSIVYGEALDMLQTLQSGADETEESSEVLQSVMDAMESLAPAGMYFGNTEGDGSDFGFWPNENGRRAALADEFARNLERKTRDNGESFICLRDGAPEWMKEAIREAHGDMLPNDWSYRFAAAIVEDIAERLRDDCDADFDDMSGEIVDSAIPVYTGERLAWLASNLNRLAFCDTAASDGLVSESSDMAERIAAGMYLELQDIAGAIWAAISAEAE